MYKLVGADGQQYGPVDAAQIRIWMAENRLRYDSLLLAEGTTEWKPLSSFPELAGATGPGGVPPLNAPPSLTSQQQAQWAARASSKLPAGLCGILLGSLGIHKFILGYTGPGLVMLLVTVLTCGIAGAITGIIGLIEGIIYITKSDEDFVRTYVDGRKEWF
jgi:TM2 domain-containing membrane protein YozV